MIQVVTALIGVFGALLAVYLKHYLEQRAKQPPISEPETSDTSHESCDSQKVSSRELEGPWQPTSASPPLRKRPPSLLPKHTNAPREPLAIASLLFCLLSIIPGFVLLCSITSIVLGHMALRRIERYPTLDGYVMAKGSLIGAYYVLAVFLVRLILFFLFGYE